MTLSGHHPGSYLPPPTPLPGVDTCPAAWGELLRTGGCSNEVTLHPSQVPGGGKWSEHLGMSSHVEDGRPGAWG